MLVLTVVKVEITKGRRRLFVAAADEKSTATFCRGRLRRQCGRDRLND